ncbi:hypothetical protein ACIBG7_07965 [Nonomuraea sp. NPDC050328]|uniref:hypothetical protein n=1 Tax=Nonomuraea sp. NPDC050328 TaxID=3364361 RepID=UPI00378A1528
MTFEELDARLRGTGELVRRARHLQGLRDGARAQLAEVRQALATLVGQLEDEERDVTRLEGGFFGFVAGLTGSREERLARERAEAEAVRQRVAGNRARVEQLQADLAAHERELAELAQAVEEYPRLLAAMERELLERADPRATELAELARHLTDVDAAISEHDHVRMSGGEALDALGQVLERLGAAQRASTWDVMGGGYMADAHERRRLQEADRLAWQAQRKLDVLARELADVGLAVQPRLAEVDTRWFADTFFDNIVTDALKHHRIMATRDAVTAMEQWVRATMDAAAARRAELAANHRDLSARREALITG